ncbi:hypothetical protein KC329_g104 [Hortaea werneckii]|nr:hypothetical protein KC329_g104 [Hortaea werneckii]
MSGESESGQSWWTRWVYSQNAPEVVKAVQLRLIPAVPFLSFLLVLWVQAQQSLPRNGAAQSAFKDAAHCSSTNMAKAFVLVTACMVSHVDAVHRSPLR